MTTITATRDQTGHCNTSTKTSPPFNNSRTVTCPSGTWAYDIIPDGGGSFTALCSDICTDSTNCTAAITTNILGSGNGTCPCIGGQGPIGAEFTSGANVITDPSNDKSFERDKQPVKCTYSLDQFKTIEDVEIYREAFTKDGEFDNSLTTLIGPEFCLGKLPNQSTFTTDGQSEGIGCPIDPNTNQRMPKCSNMVSSDTKVFEFCQAWRTAETESTFNSLVTNYCSQFNTPDCACINCLNKTDQPICSVIATELPGTESCWWAPCKKGSDNIYIQRKGAECTNSITVCDQVNNIINNRGLKINQRSSRTQIDCNSDTTKPDSPTSRSKFVIIGILIIIVIIAVLAIAANKK